jgi:hypothetical protein
MVRPPKTYQAPCPLGRLGVPCFSLYRLTVFHFPDRLLGLSETCFELVLDLP